MTNKRGRIKKSEAQQKLIVKNSLSVSYFNPQFLLNFGFPGNQMQGVIIELIRNYNVR